MGAMTFRHSVSKVQYPDWQRAFTIARAEAQYDHGHSGYTGTIAEKDEAVLYVPPAGVTAAEAIDSMLNGWDKPRPEWADAEWDNAYAECNDKWNAAVCVETQNYWVFFGWASC